MPRILYFISEDWNVLSHFQPMLRAAQEAGFGVTVATRVSKHRADIERLGYEVVALDAERRSLNPLRAVSTLSTMVRIVRDLRPDVVHCVSVRQCVLGGIAARVCRVPTLILAPIGLGHLWIAEGVLVSSLRQVVQLVIGQALRSRQTHYCFENPEDPEQFGLRHTDQKVTIVNGAGVDETAFNPCPEPPAPPIRVAVIARMTQPKGIPESVEAIRQARASGIDVELHLYGGPDPSNPQSLSEAQLRTYAGEAGVHWHGPIDQAQVAEALATCHIAMLLSHREGLPRALVEASAAERAIIATDVTGCRQIVEDGITGILVRPRQPSSAASAISKIATDQVLRTKLAAAARAKFINQFNEQHVRRQFLQLYKTLTPANRLNDCPEATLS